MSQDATGPHREPHGIPSDVSDAIFARRLRSVREQAGMTQRQLADTMTAAGSKMHATAIAKIEAGVRSATVGEAAQLASILGVDLAEMVIEPRGNGDGERKWLDRVATQVQIGAMEREIDRRQNILHEQQALLEILMKKLDAVRRHLDDLGGPMSYGVPDRPVWKTKPAPSRKDGDR